MKFAHFSHIWGKPGMSPHQRYEQLWRELQLCDALDYDYAFCVEHQFRPDESWMSSPSLFAVGAGARAVSNTVISSTPARITSVPATCTRPSVSPSRS